MQKFLHTVLLPSFLLLSIVCTVTSCGEEAPMYLNTAESRTQIQRKIEKLTKGMQVDSVSLRSTSQNSLLSSIYIVATDEKSESETKKTIEFIPKQKLTLEGDSKIKKDALHSYKIDVSSLDQYIDKAKGMLPANYSYLDVNSIMYAASPFGEKYYLALQVSPKGEYVPDEFVEVFYTQPNMMVSQDLYQPSSVSDECYLVIFLLQNSNLELLKR